MEIGFGEHFSRNCAKIFGNSTQTELGAKEYLKIRAQRHKESTLSYDPRWRYGPDHEVDHDMTKKEKVYHRLKCVEVVISQALTRSPKMLWNSVSTRGIRSVSKSCSTVIYGWRIRPSLSYITVTAYFAATANEAQSFISLQKKHSYIKWFFCIAPYFVSRMEWYFLCY